MCRENERGKATPKKKIERNYEKLLGAYSPLFRSFITIIHTVHRKEEKKSNIEVK